MERETYIVQSGRTPIGAFGGALSEFSAPQLGAAVITGLLDRLDLDVNEVEEV